MKYFGRSTPMHSIHYEQCCLINAELQQHVAANVWCVIINETAGSMPFVLAVNSGSYNELSVCGDDGHTAVGANRFEELLTAF